MESTTLRGTFGFVEFENGKVIKKPFENQEVSTNREYIAYARMDQNLSLSIAKLYQVELSTHEKQFEYVSMLRFENAGTDLSQWLHSQRRFDPVDVLLKPLLDTLEYLNRIGIVHGDLHPRNICVHCNARGQLTAKLIDFGRSVVLRDAAQWVHQPNFVKCWTDPLTGMLSDQMHLPKADSKEAIIECLYNVCLHRDPMSVIAVAAAKGSKALPAGLTLGLADDVYGLGMCAVRSLTNFYDLPWEEWRLLNDLDTIAEFQELLAALSSLFQWNPAWDASFFTDLHLRLRPELHCADHTGLFESKTRAIEIYLQSVIPLFPHFFDHLTKVYDNETSDLVRRCVHPDRHHRYPQTTRRKMRNEEGEVKFSRRGVIRPVLVEEMGVVHILLGHCWVMTGIVGSGRVKWLNAVQGMITGDRQGVVVLKLFIDKAQELDPSLTKTYRNWPFDFEMQRDSWLEWLAAHDLEKKADPVRDMEPDPQPPSNDTSAQEESQRTLPGEQPEKKRPRAGSSCEKGDLSAEDTSKAIDLTCRPPDEVW